jgi:HAMP domain-containing protein
MGIDPDATRTALVDIPWPHRLATRVFLATIFVAVGLLAGLAALDAKMSRQIEEQATRSNALLAEAIQSTTREAMLMAVPTHAYRSMGAIGRLPSVLRLRVYDKSGRVVFSSLEREVGMVLPRSAAPCLHCHATPQPISRVPASGRGHVERVDGERALATVSPIYNEHTCATAECHAHPPGRAVLGLLEIAVSLAPIEGDITAFRYQTVLFAGAAVLLLAWIFWLVARAELVQPVAALVEGTHRVARNELDVEIRVASRGEMGCSPPPSTT